MHEWFHWLFGSRTERALPSEPPSADVRVLSDNDRIVVERQGEPSDVLEWTMLSAVDLLAGGPARDRPEFVWVLQDREHHRIVEVPMGVPGEHELVRTMQVRLPGFDNMAVVEALSARDASGYTVWDEEWARAPAVD